MAEQDQPKQEVVSITVRNSDGTLREARRAGNGRFRKVPKLIPTVEVTSMLRKWLNASVPVHGEAGEKKMKMQLQAMFENIAMIARGESKMDPKAQMAAVQAFEALMLRAHGKPSINDEEKEALKYGGVKVVMIQAPTGIPEVVEETRERLKVPSFLVPESIETNPPKE